MNRATGGPAPIHSALLEGADHRSEGQDPAQSLDVKPGLQGSTALDFDTASVSREPYTMKIWGLHLP